MKAKRITNRNQLIGGQFYIRAYVNAYGPAIEVIKVFGKPYREDKYAREKNLWNIQTGRPLHSKKPEIGRPFHRMFTSDMGAEGNRSTCALYEFNSALFQHLKEIKKKLNSGILMTEFIQRRKLSQDEVQELYSDWASDLSFDRMMDRQWSKSGANWNV